MFQSVIKLFQMYKFFDCKYQLAYQRSRSSNKGRLRPDRSDSIHSSSCPRSCPARGSTLLVVRFNNHLRLKGNSKPKNL
ncbi:hypothetical protein F2Q69_00046269 [Brassica cretica]|uniref:Uncharacterized protein n=1 Tax=Brassica cretica TaxID=69181 RepID=A0A8S9PLB9_BRACR|nr:hypothetical protein F2Q69_00046269 [Brassica cretica]